MFEGLKILYLEDEPLVAFDTGEHLMGLGFETVEVTYRLVQAEKAIEQQGFDLALLDINVDRGNTSLELGRNLAKQGTHVVFASGNSSAAEDLGNEGYCFLDKPISLDELTQTLASVVEGK